MSAIPTIQQLLDSLPNEVKTPDIIEQITFFYRKETKLLFDYASEAKEPDVFLLPFKEAGRQFIADFWVNDLSLPVKNQYNWHLQNTSQWLYAGCILVEDGRVSTHH